MIFLHQKSHSIVIPDKPEIGPQTAPLSGGLKVTRTLHLLIEATDDFA